MNYAFMTFSTPELTLEENLALARELGYDALEPRAEAGHRHGIEIELDEAGRRCAREAVKESGVALCCLATSARFAAAEDRRQHLPRTHEHIDLAGDIGCPRLRVFGGALPEGLTRHDAVAVVAEALRSLADHAAERGVTLCVETHDDWCRPDDVVAVMQRVDHPAVAVNWDIMHPVRAGGATMDEAFDALHPWIRHVHFHDGIWDEGRLAMVPIGKGRVDHARALQLLQDSGYDGYLSGEWIDWVHQDHLPRELAAMKRLEGMRSPP